jgi:hypothetical protein
MSNDDADSSRHLLLHHRLRDGADPHPQVPGLEVIYLFLKKLYSLRLFRAALVL